MKEPNIEDRRGSNTPWLLIPALFFVMVYVQRAAASEGDLLFMRMLTVMIFFGALSLIVNKERV